MANGVLRKFTVSRFVKVNDEWAEIKKSFLLSEIEQFVSYLVETSKTCSKVTISFIKDFDIQEASK